MKNIKHTCAGLVFLVVCCISPAAADITAPDMFVFDLINQYRAAPFAHAVSLGYDPVVLQEKGIGPETVFAPYELDEELRDAAEDENFRASVADPEAEPLPPVRARMTRTSSVFSFSHFMPMETAGHIFVKNLFKNELDTGIFPYILSEKYRYAGTSADPGVVPDTRMNAWFFTLVLGSLERTSEIQMLNLINQIRSKPALVQSYMDTDFMDILHQNPNIYYLPRLVLQPVFSNSLLQGWARTDAGEPAPADEAGSGEFEPSEPVDHRQLYPGNFLQTATVGTFWQDPAAARPVTDLFFALLRSELATWPFSAVVFSNQYTEVGTALSVDIAGETGSGILSVYAGSRILETASETALPVSRIYGIVFSDQGGDRLYRPGQEIAGQTITVYDESKNPVASAVSDNAGHFSLILDSGRHWVVTTRTGEQTVSQAVVTIADSNRFVKLAVPPEPTPPLIPPDPS